MKGPSLSPGPHLGSIEKKGGRQDFRAHLAKVRLCGDLTLVTVFCDWLSRPNKKSQIQKVCGWWWAVGIRAYYGNCI